MMPESTNPVQQLQTIIEISLFKQGSSDQAETHFKLRNRTLGDQAPAVLCADSKRPIQKRLPRHKDSLKNLHYPLCHHSSATPLCIGQTIFPTFAVLLGSKPPLLQWCFAYS